MSSVYYLGSSIIERCDCDGINLGKGGLRSSDLIKYYNRIRVVLKGNVVVMYIGSNDIRAKQDAKIVYTNIVNYIESIIHDVKKIIYIAILKGPSVLSNEEKAINYVNANMRKYASTNAKVEYMNVNRELKSEKYYLKDNVHLNLDGNAILRNKIISMI
jgi:lysophospholipase L1-like esterase